MSDPSLPARFPALQDRRFTWFLTGMVASNVGSWLERLALQTFVYRISGHDEAWLAIVAFAPALPVFLVSVPAGAVVDRVNVRRLVLFTQFAMMFAALGMVAWIEWGDVKPWHVAGYALLSSALFSIDAPARHALVPRIVPREHHTNAVALNAFGFNAARLLGGIAFWAVIHLLGGDETECVALNAASYILPIAVLLRIRESPPVPHADDDHPDHGAGASTGRALLAGLRYAWRTPAIRGALLLLAMSGLFGFQVSQLLPVFAEKVFHTGRDSVGTMQAAFGGGALIGALALASKSATAHRGRIAVTSSLLAAVFVGAVAFAPSMPVATAILPVIGFLLIRVHSTCIALIHANVPDILRGRVSSLFTLTVLGCFPVGGLFVGFVAKSWGAPGTTLLCAELLLGSVLAVAWSHRGLRDAA